MIDSHSWQQAFVDHYLSTSPRTALLVAPLGAGKRTVAIELAQSLRLAGKIESVAVFTSVEDDVPGWMLSVPEPETAYWEVYLTDSPISRILSSPIRRFIIADNLEHTDATLQDAKQLLEESEQNRLLFIAHSLPANIDLDLVFHFARQLILDPRLATRHSTEVRLSPLAPSFSVLRSLQKHSPIIDDMTWRQFEKLIATLLERDGYKVELMRGTKDGGVDVVALRDMGSSGWFKTLWQAKKTKVSNRVGLCVVRELADTRAQLGASKAIVVTSSYLTSGALQRIERDKYVLGKVDRDDLDRWMDRTLFS